TGRTAVNDQDRAYYQCPMPPGEPAYRLRLEFARTPTATFTPQELWAVRRLAAPAAGKTTSSGITVSRQGVKLTLLGIAAAGARIPNAGPDIGGRANVCVDLT